MAIDTKPRHGPASTIGSLKEILRPYPQYRAVRSAYKMLARNASLLRHIAREGLSARLLLPSSRSSRQTLRQQVVSWTLSIPGFAESHELIRWLRSRGLTVNEGRNTIYLPPGDGLTDLLAPQMGTYPRTSGFKILKRFGPPAETHYLAPNSQLGARSRLIGSPLDQLISANYMYALGIGPRVWDVACWNAGGEAYTVFVVDHIEGRSPTREQCAAFITHLKHLITSTHLRIVLPDWERSSDFTSPDCNQNLVISADVGRAQYVDFQNFCLPHAPSWTRDILSNAKGTFHFGGGRLIRGSRYLYQSVPGLATSAKRDTSSRWQWLTRALREATLDLHGRVVLDIGCNSGLMLHAALAAGARWGLGWDRPAVARHAEELLLSLGTSRFHLYGADLHPSYRLEEDIPVRLAPALQEAVVFYLSVRQHVGVLDSLQQIPWRLLVYEGHQGEELRALPGILAPLLRDNVRCVSSSLVADGDSGPRPIALLRRALTAPVEPRSDGS